MEIRREARGSRSGKRDMKTEAETGTMLCDGGRGLEPRYAGSLEKQKELRKQILLCSFQKESSPA